MVDATAGATARARGGGTTRERAQVGVAVPRAHAHRARCAVRGPDPGHAGHQPHVVGPADAGPTSWGSTTSATCWPTTGSGWRSATRSTTRSCRCPWAWPWRWPSRSASNQAIRGIAWIRTMYFLPLVTSSVAVGLVWLWIYAPQGGLLNEVLGVVPHPAPEAGPRTRSGRCRPSSLMSVWQGLGISVDRVPRGAPVHPPGLPRRRVRGWRRPLGALPAHHPAAAHAEHLLHGHPEPHRRAPGVRPGLRPGEAAASPRRPPSRSSTSSTRRASATSGWAPRAPRRGSCSSSRRASPSSTSASQKRWVHYQ